MPRICKHWKLVLIILLLLYIVVAFYVTFHFILLTLKQPGSTGEYNPWELAHDFVWTSRPLSHPTVQEPRLVEVWGKAAIGLYLWKHIFEGSLIQKSSMWEYGEMRIGNILFRFRTGPAIIPSHDVLPMDMSGVVLVLNGRDDSKIEFSKMWLDYASYIPHLNGHVGVVILGNEQCNNTWIKQYMTSAGGPVKFVFLVYDSPEIDNHSFYQWPLGVATYRSFPVVKDVMVNMGRPRLYTCNFLGTVYPGSSRVDLINILKSKLSGQSCFVRTRNEWQPKETKDSLNDYLYALSNSDLTLCPVGMNAESYRIYEAMSYGSVPVIEDRSTGSTCGYLSNSSTSQHKQRVAYRLLKEFRAPVIFIKDWSALPFVMNSEMQMNQTEKVTRRKKVINWYRTFRRKMRTRFVEVINKRLF